ncbi:hypothetical protein ACP70R_030507 [Stipagrostis hirtigluma subsp. patula]
MASSSASRSAGRSWEFGSRPSPIQYRVGPLQYQPPEFCHCGEKAALWISWSDENPGRRYMTCYRAREGGCEYARWYDASPPPPFVRTLLVDLRDAVWSLKRERDALRRALCDATQRLEEQRRALQRGQDEPRRALCDATQKLEEQRRALPATELDVARIRHACAENEEQKLVLQATV